MNIAELKSYINDLPDDINVESVEYMDLEIESNVFYSKSHNILYFP